MRGVGSFPYSPVKLRGLEDVPSIPGHNRHMILIVSQSPHKKNAIAGRCANRWGGESFLTNTFHLHRTEIGGDNKLIYRPPSLGHL
jgi:hypothetical protein